MKRFARAALPPVLSALEFVTATLLFVMILLTFADVVGRYAFSRPIFGAAEMIEFLLATLIFSALGLVNASDSHISVEIFEHRIAEIMPKTHAVVVKGASALAMAAIAWQVALRAVEAHRHADMTVVLEWPLYWVIGAVAVFSFISLVAQMLGWFLAGTGYESGDVGGYE